MALGQYIKDTRAELRHVAWPTRSQTIVYTILVALISIGVALYLGFFDFVFTTGLSKALNVIPGNTSGITVKQQPAAPSNSTTTPSSNGAQPNFNLPK